MHARELVLLGASFRRSAGLMSSAVTFAEDICSFFAAVLILRLRKFGVFRSEPAGGIRAARYSLSTLPTAVALHGKRHSL